MTERLIGKKILIVDDEPDILEALCELLDMCVIDYARNFETAERLLKENSYDAAILDIMGVRGYDLLQLARGKDLPALMLTAHALSPDNLKKSIELGADAYIPKAKMVDISLYVEDVLSSRQDKKKNNFKWYARFMPFFDKFFGEGWKDPEKEFWDEFDKKYVEQ